MAVSYSYPINFPQYNTSLVDGFIYPFPTTGNPFVLDQANRLVASGNTVYATSGYMDVNAGVSSPHDTDYLRFNNGFSGQIWRCQPVFQFGNPPLSGLMEVSVNYRVKTSVSGIVGPNGRTLTYDNAFHNYNAVLISSGNNSIVQNYATAVTFDFGSGFGAQYYTNLPANSTFDLSEIELQVSGYLYPNLWKSFPLYLHSPSNIQTQYPVSMVLSDMEYGTPVNTRGPTKVSAVSSASFQRWIGAVDTGYYISNSFWAPTSSGKNLATFLQNRSGDTSSYVYTITSSSGYYDGVFTAIVFDNFDTVLNSGATAQLNMIGNGVYSPTGPLTVTADIYTVDPTQGYLWAGTLGSVSYNNNSAGSYVPYVINVPVNKNTDIIFQTIQNKNKANNIDKNNYSVVFKFGIVAPGGNQVIELFNTWATMFGSGNANMYMNSNDWSNSPTLYVSGPSGINQPGPTLHTWGNLPKTSGIPLYVYGEVPMSGSIPLIVNGPSGWTNSMPLYTIGPVQSGNQATLFVKGDFYHDQQILPINWETSYCHSSGDFTHSGIFSDYYFGFEKAPTLVNTGNNTYIYNGQSFGNPKNPIWQNSLSKSGQVEIFTQAFGPTESGWGLIAAPGRVGNRAGALSQLSVTDGTQINVLGGDYVQTSEILPWSGNYSLLVELCPPRNQYNDSIFGSQTLSYYSMSGTRIMCDGVALWTNGQQWFFNYNYTNIPIGYSPANFIISYSGAYAVWVGYDTEQTSVGFNANEFSLACVTPPTPRYFGSGLYSTHGTPYQGGTLTSGNVIIEVNQSNPYGNTAIGIQKIASIASGISKSTVDLMNISQESLTTQLNDLHAHPSGYITYNAYAGNSINSDTNYGGNSKQSFLPDGQVPSGATNYNYGGNIGAYTSGYFTNYIASYGLQPNYVGDLSSGIAFHYTDTNVIYSGWITSNFSGTFNISLVKDGSYSTYNQQIYTNNTTYEEIVYNDYFVTKYKIAWGDITITSGTNLYVVGLPNLIEANFQEEEQGINYYTIVSGQYYYQWGYSNYTYTQNSGAVNWDGAWVQTSNEGVTPTSGAITNYNAKINNAVFFSNYLGIDVPSTGNGITLYTYGNVGYSGHVDLFIYNALTAGIDLFVQTDPITLITAPLPLNIWTVGSSSGYASSSTNLYLNSFGNISGNIPLYINGTGYGITTNKFPLSIKSQDPVMFSGGVQLMLNGPQFSVPQFSTISAPLYLSNYGIVTSGAPLFTLGPASGFVTTSVPILLFNNDNLRLNPLSNSIPMFVGSQYINNGTTLYTVGPTFADSFGNSWITPTLFIAADKSGQNSVPLYINSVIPGNVSGSAPLFINSYLTISNQSGNIPLSIMGPQAMSGYGPSLYIKGTPLTKSTTLFIRNNYYDIANANVPLSIANILNASGNVSLFTLAGLCQNTTTLFMDAPSQNMASGFTTLFTRSAAHSSISTTSTLFMEAGAIWNGSPLYIAGPPFAYQHNSATLFTKAGNFTSKSVQLYIESVRASGSAVNLNIAGAGFTNGAHLGTGSIPLFMARDGIGVGAGTTLYMSVPSGNTYNAPMYIKGGTHSFMSTNLAMPYVYGLGNNKQSLFVSGF
jgi:hypothetical protein